MMSFIEVDTGNIDHVWEALDQSGFSTGPPAMLPKHLDLMDERRMQTKGRRSWFDTPPASKLEIVCEEHLTGDHGNRRHSNSKSRPSTHQEAEEMETLILTHFTYPPRIGFGKIKPGKTRTRQLLVKNPHDYEQEVNVERIPRKKNFSVDQELFVVGPEKSVVLTISWSPVDDGPYREMFLFHVDGVYRLQAFVFGVVETPPQRRKADKKGLLGSKVKRPFSVLHTQNFVNIKQAYTPKHNSNGSAKNLLLGYSKPRPKTKQRELENTPPEHLSERLVSHNASPAESSRVVTLSYTSTPDQAIPVPTNKNSVRRSVTYTKICDPADTPARTSVMLTISPTLSIIPDQSDTMTLETSILSTCGTSSDTPKVPLSSSIVNSGVSNLLEKIDITPPNAAGVKRYVPLPCLVSPNTFLQENLAALAMPEKSDIISKDMERRLFTSQERSSHYFKDSIVTQTETSNSNIRVEETITKRSQSVSIVHSEYSQERFTTTPISDRNQSLASVSSVVHVSPTSFLRESMSNTPSASLDISALSDTIPSPGMVLNNSMPHDIVVRQLGSVRNSLTGRELPPYLYRSPAESAMSNKPFFISVGSSDYNKQQKKAIFAVSKTRRRSGTKCTNQKKLFSEITDAPSPRRTTFLVNTNKSGKTPSSVQRLQKAGSKFVNKVVTAMAKSKPSTRKPIKNSQRKSINKKVMGDKSEDMACLRFSPLKNSPNVETSTSIENEARLTMTIKQSKVLVPKKTTRDVSKVQSAASKNNPLKLPNTKSKPCIDSSTVTKPKQDPVEKRSSGSRSNSTKPSNLAACAQFKVPPPGGAGDNVSIDQSSPKELFPAEPSLRLQAENGCNPPVVDIGSPQNLPTSPQPDLTRRATLTVTKSQPSDALVRNIASKTLFSNPSPVRGGVRRRISVGKFSPSSIREESSPNDNSLKNITMNGHMSGDVKVTAPGRTDNFDLNANQSSDGLSKILMDYNSNSSQSGSSTEVSPVRGNEHGILTDHSQLECKKISPAVDHQENFLAESQKQTACIQNTPHREAGDWVARENGRQQLPTLISNSSNSTVDGTTQKKRYHSDSSALLERSCADRQQKKPKVGSNDGKQTTAVRTRRSTDPPVKQGDRKCRGKPFSRPAVAQSRLVLVKKTRTVLPKHPMPFAAKNMYYDERWMEKQERGFVKWLNFVLTPPEEYQTGDNKTKVDAGSVNLDIRVQTIRLAPTKEVLSLRAYAARRRMNRLRRAACRLYQSESVIHIIQKLEAEVESYRLRVRKDRMIHADVGIKQRVLDLILSYNPLWLRIGLETVFGEILPLQSNSDVIGISRFVITRLLGNPDIAQEYSHPTVPHFYRDGYQGAVSKHVLKKFLMLVYFLDEAKKARLIDHDPCLFCTDAEWKSSRDLLIQFAKDYLSGEGDITRHLGFLGYTIKHSQTALDEFDYAVTSLAKDLRDGLRITRVIELLSQKWDLCKRLRVPAISRLQKVHNMEVTFRALTEFNQDFDPTNDGKISPRDIVDGHREKTLALLWRIIFNFQVEILLDEAKLREEIDVLSRCLRVRRDWLKLNDATLTHMTDSPDDKSLDKEICHNSEKIRLLLEWCRVVCAFYKMKIENFTVSFSDGRALCYLVHHYYPGLLPLSAIQSQTSIIYQDEREADQSHDLDDSFASPMVQQIGADSNQLAVYDTLLANERENFRLLYEKVSELGGIPLMLKAVDMSNTIPDEKVVITYVAHLCVRLLDIREEMNAARRIQIAWRKYRILCRWTEQKKRNVAAIYIQKHVREFLQRRQHEREAVAVVTIQTFWRSLRARQQVAALRWEKKNKEKTDAVCLIQNAVRSFIKRRNFLRIRRCIVCIQTCVRAYLARKNFQRTKLAASRIQDFYRSFVKTRVLRCEFLQKKTAAIYLQTAFRRVQADRLQRKVDAVTLLQAQWRYQRQRKIFLRLRQAAVLIQSAFRGFSARRMYTVQKNSAIIVQRKIRALQCMRRVRQRYLQMKDSAIILQSQYRGLQQRRRYKEIKMAVIHIQSCFRGYKASVKFQALQLATIIVQRQYRAHVMMRHDRSMYVSLRSACLFSQRRWRESKRQRLEQRKQAAMKIQSAVRDFLARKETVRRKRAAVVLQSATRGYLAHRNFQRKRNAVISIQSCVRGFLERQSYLRTLKAVSTIQKHYRLFQYRCSCLRLLELDQAAVTLQSIWRMYLVRKRYRQTRCSVMKVQSLIRGAICRRKLVRMRKAVILIQCYYRAYRFQVKLQEYLRFGAAVTIQCSWKRYWQQQRYQRVRHAAVKIQTCWKGFYARRVYEKYLLEINCAVKIQSWWRGVSERNQYSAMRNTAIRMQRIYWNSKLTKELRNEFLDLKKAAVVCQANWRMQQGRQLYVQKRMAVVKLQSFRRGAVARRDFLRRRRAAVTIQEHFRAYLEGEHVRYVYHLMTGAAITIQSAWKSYFVRRKYQNLRMAAILIQGRVKGHQARVKFLQIRRATLTLQTWYRGLVCRLNYHVIKMTVITLQARVRGSMARGRYCRLKQAVCTVQRRYRALCAKTQARHRYLQKREAVLHLQRTWRTYQANKNARKLSSVIKIQAWTRGCLLRKQFIKQKSACIRIQAAVRRHQARQNFQNLREAAVVLQRKLRARKAGQVQRNLYVSQKRAVIVLQSVVRGFLAHQKLKRNHLAATVLQRAYKTRLCRLSFLRQRKAVIFIQRHAKARLMMVHMRNDFRQKKEACVLLQSAVRGMLGRNIVRNLRVAILIKEQQRQEQILKETSVVKIQALFRGYVKRKRYICQRSAAILIQSRVRGFLARDGFLRMWWAAMVIKRWWLSTQLSLQERLEFKTMIGAAVIIQSTYRSYKVRQLYLCTRNSVIRLQALIRGSQVRSKICRRKLAALTIQNWYRRHKMAQLERHLFLEQRVAITRLQSLVRGYMCRQHVRKIRAAMTIQSAYRSCKVRNWYVRTRKSIIGLQALVRGSQVREEIRRWKSAAVTVQTWYRRLKTAQQQRQYFLQTRLAIIQVQSLVRGYLGRQHVRKIRAAVTIQSAYRSCKVRHWYVRTRKSIVGLQSLVRGSLVRAEIHRRKSAAVLVQTWYRRLKMVQQQRRCFLQTRAAIVQVQSLTRGYLVRRFVKITRAAISIQSTFRMIRARNMYRQQRLAVVRLQSWTRGLLARRLYQRLRFAVWIIQRNIRAYAFCSCIRKAANLRTKSATKIQQWYRDCLQRQRTKQANAALKIQATYRGYRLRSGYQRLRRAVLLVQSHYRKCQAMKAYKYLIAMYEEHKQAQLSRFMVRAREELSAITVQRAYRKHRLLERAKAQISSVVVIQRWVMARLARIRYLGVIKSVCRIQRGVRLWQRRRCKAARTIQTAVRTWLDQKHLQERTRAATVLQAAWRGHQVRKQNCKKLRQVRRRVHDANKAATEDKKLGQRTASALDYLLRYKQLAYILDSLIHLDVVTRLSAECCLTIVEGNAVGVIYTLIRSCNRSLPHMELIKYCISILLNLAKFHRTISAVYEVEDSVSTLIDLMQIYREKGIIFSKTCTLLAILCLDEGRKQEVCGDVQLTDRILSLQCLTARKQKVNDTRMATKAKLMASRTSFNSTLPLSPPRKRVPKVRPEWLLRRDSLQEIEDPLRAINFVMDTLRLTPRPSKC